MQEKEILRFKLVTVKRRFAESGIKWVIFAGAAACFYGSKREFQDVDILVKREDLARAKAVLKQIDIRGFDISCGVETQTPQGTCNFFLDKEMLMRKKWGILAETKVPMISVEDNIVLKAILQRGENEGKHDIEDIRHMTTNRKIDIEYLRNRIGRCNAKKRVRHILEPVVPGLR